jgi:hypothetical protein
VRRVESQREAEQLRVAPLRATLHPAQQVQPARARPVLAGPPGQAAVAWRLPELLRPET